MGEENRARYLKVEAQDDSRVSIQSVCQYVASIVGCNDIQIDVNRVDKIVKFIYIWDDEHTYTKSCDFSTMARFEANKEEMKFFLLNIGKEVVSYAVDNSFIPEDTKEIFSDDAIKEFVTTRKTPSVYKDAEDMYYETGWPKGDGGSVVM